MVIRHAVQLTATGNCDVQLAPFVTFTSTPDIIITRGEFFSTYRLVQDQPLQIITNKTVVGSGALGGGGILIRTFTSGVDILALTGSLNLNKQKK
jgi:hypothetical protein